MGYSYNGFLAHPDEYLADHLQQVGEACKRRISQLFPKGPIWSLAEIVGKTHDFGKYNLFFQEHLRTGRRGHGELQSHAPLSAVYCAYTIQTVIGDPLFALLGSYSVWHHHQNLITTMQDFIRKFNQFPENPNFVRQLNTIEENKDSIGSEVQRLNLPSIDGFLRFVDQGELQDLAKNMYRSIPQASNFQSLYQLLLLFSLLIDSDKRLAAHLETPLTISTAKNYDIQINNLEKFISTLKSENHQIQVIRAEIRTAVLNELEKVLKLPNIPKLMSINAPTGTGKTLLSFDCALRLRSEIQKRTGKNLRIIYVLPYINIIDQTYDILSRVLGIEEGDNDKEEHIIKHHHLFAPGQRNSDYEELPNEKKMALIESWDSEIIVTTFVQFMETLIGTRNRMLKKFNKIFDSIIIIDEIQAFSPELWKFVIESLKELPDGCYVIMMSATMPGIFSEVAYPLLADSWNYFARMNRTRYEYIKNDLQPEDLIELVLNKWERKSLLIVLNTIRASITVYNLLKERLRSLNPIFLGAEVSTECWYDKDRPLLCYLSTNIVPKERLNRIRVISEQLQKSRPTVLVSTQVVEAGVDIDFEKVMREIAPLDSIVQSAGRCNRNWKSDIGTVYVFKLKDERGYNWKRVYSLLSVEELTIPIFEKQKNIIEEREFGRSIANFYDRKAWVESLLESQESLEYIEAARRMDLSKLSEFKLIKDDPKASAFINLDHDSNSRLEYLRKVVEQRKNSEKNYLLLNKLRYAWIRAQEYIVDTWNPELLPLEELIPDEGYARGVKLVDTKMVDRYYDRETGLKIGEHSDAFIF